MSLVIDVREIIEESRSPLLAKHPSWGRLQLSDVASIQNGFAFKSSRFSKSNGVPLVRIRDVGQDRTVCCYDGPYEEQYLVQPGDLLVGMDGDFRAARWRGPTGLLNQRVCRIAVDERVYVPRFLEYVLPGYLSAIHDYTSSQTVKHLSSRSIAEIPLPLPPLAEQRRIVEAAEALLARVEAARQRLAKVPTLLAWFRQSMLAAACSGGLTEKGRVTAATWRETTVGDLAATIQYGYTAPAKARLTGPRFLRITDIQNGQVEWSRVPSCEISAADEENFRLQPGDILFARSGATTGKSFLVGECPRAVFASYLIRVRVRRDVILPEFLYLFFQTPRYWAAITDNLAGNAQPNCNASKLALLKVTLPPIEEQEQIVRRANELLGLADAVEKRVATVLGEAERFPQTVFSKAFAGELVPTELELAAREGRDYVVPR